MAGEDLDDYYAVGNEATRLTRSMRGRLEFLRTQDLIRRFLPRPPSQIVDVGGGTGVHASWLAKDGYQVHVVDPVARHVESAKVLDGVTGEIGDARVLSQATDSIDAVLILGPLYHLAEVSGRKLALNECHCDPPP